MRWKEAAGLAVVALTVLLAPIGLRTAAGDENPVAPERSDYAVQAGCAPLTVPVVLAMTSPALMPSASVPVRITGVDQAWAASLKGFFTAAVQAGGRTVAVHIGRGGPNTSCADRLPPPGTYHLVVDAVAVHAGSTKAKAWITVDVTVPAATLSGEESLTIEQYVDCPFNWCLFGDPPVPTGTLTLRESSGAAAAAGIRIGATLDYSSDEPVTKPRITMTLGEIVLGPHEQRNFCLTMALGGDQIVLGPHEQRNFCLTVSGDLRPGTTKARAEIVSTRTISGFSVMVAVTRRQTALAFALVIAAGILAGVLVRKVLTRLVEDGRRRRRAEEVIARLRTRAASAADATFRGELEQIAVGLGPAVRAAATAQAATQVIDDAEKAGEAAVTRRATRLADAVHARDVWSTQLAASGRWSEVIGAQLEAGRAACKAVDDAISKNDATTAARLVKEQTATTLRAATEAARAWTEKIRSELRRLRRGDCNELMPARYRDQFDQLDPRLEDATGGVDSGDVQELSQVQLAINEAGVVAERLDTALVDLGVELHQAVNAVVRQWGFTPDNDLIDDLRDLEAGATGNGSIFDRLRDRIDAACGAVRRMRTMCNSPANQSRVPPESQGPYDTAVLVSDYARLTVLAGVATAGPRALGVAPDDGRWPVEAAAAAAAAGPAPLDTTPPTSAVRGLPGPGRVSTASLTVLRWMLLFGILAIASLVVLPLTVVGTTAQLAGVFFWAFSIDLAFEGLSKVAAGWATAPKLG